MMRRQAVLATVAVLLTAGACWFGGAHRRPVSHGEVAVRLQEPDGADWLARLPNNSRTADTLVRSLAVDDPRSIIEIVRRLHLLLDATEAVEQSTHDQITLSMSASLAKTTEGHDLPIGVVEDVVLRLMGQKVAEPVRSQVAKQCAVAMRNLRRQGDRTLAP